MSRSSGNGAAYWRANLRLVFFLPSDLGPGVFWPRASCFGPLLSSIEIGGTDLGFWFAQQGSILVFLFLIFFYAIRMNALDREHGVHED